LRKLYIFCHIDRKMPRALWTIRPLRAAVPRTPGTAFSLVHGLRPSKSDPRYASPLFSSLQTITSSHPDLNFTEARYLAWPILPLLVKADHALNARTRRFLPPPPFTHTHTPVPNPRT